MGTKKKDNEKFELLKRAIFNKNIISFDYIGSHGKASKRKVKPARIHYKSNAWYLQAYCMEKLDYRTFKINRIIEAIITSEYFNDILTPPSLDTIQNDTTYPLIKLKFHKEVSHRVYDGFDHSFIQEQENGDLIIECNFPEDSWLYGYLLSFCGYVKIIEPEYIKKTFLKTVKELYLHYQ